MTGKSTRIFQTAFIVNDLEESCAKWARTMGIGPFTLLENIDLPNIIYRGEPGELNLSAALAASGDLQVELIQPHHDHPSVYRDYYPTGQEGYHHIGVFWPPALPTLPQKALASSVPAVIRKAPRLPIWIRGMTPTA
jgi:hypothetical protein